MTTIASTRRSSFGMSCAHCDNELIAPEWTEHRNERHIRTEPCPCCCDRGAGEADRLTWGLESSSRLFEHR